MNINYGPTLARTKADIAAAVNRPREPIQQTRCVDMPTAAAPSDISGFIQSLKKQQKTLAIIKLKFVSCALCGGGAWSGYFD